MPPRNTNPLPGKMPNGQDREVYTKQCHEFIETNYAKLKTYALYQTHNKKDEALDLLQSTCYHLLEGWDNIKFDTSPLAYVQRIMTRIRWRPYQLAKREIDRSTMFCDESLLDMFAMVGYSHPHEQTDFQFLVQNFSKLTFTLTPREAQYLEWMLEKTPYKEKAKTHNVTRARMQQIQAKVLKKIKKAAETLLEDVPEDGLEL